MTRKNRTLTWLNIFLLVINLSAFATLLFLNHDETEQVDDRFTSDQLLRQELNLSNDQFHEISMMNNNVFRSYQAFLDYKCELNFKIINELSTEQPSDSIMESLANRIGTIDANMKKKTIQHFKNIKSVCTEEQKVKLDQFMKEMMEAGDNCKYCNKRNCSRRDQLNQKK